MASPGRSFLGRAIHEARERLDISQEVLAERLKLARPISISKWERGEAPVPVHHWRELMAILEISLPAFVEAAKKDHHRQLGLFLSLSGSIQDSARELGGFAWDSIIKTLAPQAADRLEWLRDQYPDLTPAEFIKSAWQYFVDHSKYGLDRNNRPIAPRGSPPSFPTSGLPARRKVRAAHKKHSA